MDACMGPAGDFPCIRREKGLPAPNTETYIAQSMRALLTKE